MALIGVFAKLCQRMAFEDECHPLVYPIGYDV